MTDIRWAEQNSSKSASVSGQPMKAYIEIVDSLAAYRKDLTEADLRHIGDFTIWGVAQWMYNKGYYGVYGCEGFHAVCGDIDIPWTTEKARSIWNKVPGGL
jgi:hypothetical protein